MIIKVGTDCSGIEAPIQALKNLGIKFSHEFSCEIDPFARESIKANYKPKVLYHDITKPRKLPHVDLYVSGFPCQPFSNSGHRLGFNDSRGNVFFHCVQTIKECQPRVFILENVKSLTTIDNGKLFKVILDTLDLGLGSKYEIHHKILNTMDYGVPQNRERLYIVGILKTMSNDSCFVAFKWPLKVKCKPLKDFIDYSDTTTEPYPQFSRKYIGDQKGIFVNLSYIRFTNPNSYQHYSPTITTASSSIYNIKLHRRANIKELLMLQGFPTNFKQVVSDYQFKKQIGNAMSVNVLEHLIKSLKCYLK